MQTVEFTSSIGCKDYDTLMVLNIGMIEIANDFGILVYPNRANEELNIEKLNGVGFSNCYT